MSSIKRHIVVMVLVCMSVQINSILACYGLFFMNRQSIAAAACEKKTRQCCGKCFLQKKVAAASESRHEDPQKPVLPKSHEELPGIEQQIVKDHHLHDDTVCGLHYSDVMNYSLRQGSLPGIDHPPKSWQHIEIPYQVLFFIWYWLYTSARAHDAVVVDYVLTIQKGCIHRYSGSACGVAGIR